MRKVPIYVSTDIEANGFQVGRNSMLSLASAAFYEDKTLANTFTINLETLPEGEESAETMTWWQKLPRCMESC